MEDPDHGNMYPPSGPGQVSPQAHRTPLGDPQSNQRNDWIAPKVFYWPGVLSHEAVLVHRALLPSLSFPLLVAAIRP